MKKLLIVEDEKILRKMYLERFEKQGIEVFSSDTAEGGFKIAKKEKPDLILMDILLPKANGVSMLKNLRKDPEMSNIKVLAFSNFDDPETKKVAKELGVVDYLMKTDYTPSQITKVVEKLLKKKQ